MYILGIESSCDETSAAVVRMGDGNREILSNIGLEFDVVTADTDESSDLTDPIALCEELAARKAEAVRAALAERGELSADDVIIASDTVVECGGEILGKPADRDDAKRMIELLSGRAHRVDRKSVV